MQNFVAIDFETANFQASSVCSVGICIVKDGEIVDNYYSLIRPVPNCRVQHHDRKGRYHSVKSTGDMGFRSPHRFRYAVSAGAPKSADTEVWAEAIQRVKQYFPYIEDGEVPFVAHNKAFDENCLKAVFAAYAEVSPMKRGNRLPAEGATISGRRRNPLRRRPLLPFHRENAPGYIAGYCGYDLKNHHLVVTNCAKWPRRSESRRSVCSSSPHKVNFAGTPKEADAEACAIIGIQIL